jgi:hypothetical protein
MHGTPDERIPAEYRQGELESAVKHHLEGAAQSHRGGPPRERLSPPQSLAAPALQETPVPKPRDQWTPAEWRDVTEGARRRARFKFAEARIRKIVDAMPAFTDEELAKLAVLLRPEGSRSP